MIDLMWTKGIIKTINTSHLFSVTDQFIQLTTLYIEQMKYFAINL